jgi:hypothetical protein
MSRRSGHAFGYADALHLALGWGAGHAACHALFLFASLLPLTTGDGSYYPDACPGMSLFLVSALNCLGTSATLLAAMAVALGGRALRGAARAAYAPAVHAASALLVRWGGEVRGTRGGHKGDAGRAAGKEALVRLAARGLQQPCCCTMPRNRKRMPRASLPDASPSLPPTTPPDARQLPAGRVLVRGAGGAAVRGRQSGVRHPRGVAQRPAGRGGAGGAG